MGYLGIPPLSSSHLPACSDPGIPRNRSCRSQARGCAPRGHWTFSERFGCKLPCEDRAESSRRAMSPGDEVEITGWQPGSWWLFLRLVWVRRWTGAKPASPSISGQEALMGCGSPLVLLPWAGCQLLQWVLRMVWLARAHDRDTGKGQALRKGTIQECVPKQFPGVPVVFHVCWVMAGEAGEGEGDPW